jgi:hypothetical protein
MGVHKEAIVLGASAKWRVMKCAMLPEVELPTDTSLRQSHLFGQLA